jgi:hypothetical protein
MRFQVLTAASMMFRIVFWDVHGSTSQKKILNKVFIGSTPFPSCEVLTSVSLLLLRLSKYQIEAFSFVSSVPYLQ